MEKSEEFRKFYKTRVIQDKSVEYAIFARNMRFSRGIFKMCVGMTDLTMEWAVRVSE